MNVNPPIDLKEFLHMKQGDAEFSYANNTIIQRAANGKSKLLIEEAVHSLLRDEIVRPGDQVLRIADLGSGVGPIPLNFISTMMEIVNKNFKQLKWQDDDEHQLPELQIYLNDLPSNDFNLLFRDVSELRLKDEQRGKPLCFVMGVPGSFHVGFSLATACTSCTRIMLSTGSLRFRLVLEMKTVLQLKKSNIYASETSPPAANKAYLAQFLQDWTSFLSCRSKEVVIDGRLVLVIRGRPSVGLQPILELHLLQKAIASLVSQGVIKEEKIQTFDFPTYSPSKEDIQEVIQKEGSFKIEHMEMVLDNIAQEIDDNYEKPEAIAKCVRGFSESVVSRHFGVQVLSALYNELIRVTQEYLSSEPPEICSVIVLLRS